MRRLTVLGLILAAGAIVLVAAQQPPAPRDPQRELLMSVADGLNITVDELLKGLHKPSRRR